MKYGANELLYAEPFAEALIYDASFRSWLLLKTKFAPWACIARPLHQEMRAKRSKKAQTWWRSHYTESCRCFGCSGQETDILAIFEADNTRFAIHIEVKNPKDKFSKPGQAPSYKARAECWAKKAPPKVLPHDKAICLLLFSEGCRQEFAPHLPHFDTLVTFEEIIVQFPNATANPVK